MIQLWFSVDFEWNKIYSASACVNQWQILIRMLIKSQPFLYLPKQTKSQINTYSFDCSWFSSIEKWSKCLLQKFGSYFWHTFRYLYRCIRLQLQNGKHIFALAVNSTFSQKLSRTSTMLSNEVYVSKVIIVKF